jgi:hypothetical protein
MKTTIKKNSKKKCSYFIVTEAFKLKPSRDSNYYNSAGPLITHIPTGTKIFLEEENDGFVIIEMEYEGKSYWIDGSNIPCGFIGHDEFDEDFDEDSSRVISMEVELFDELKLRAINNKPAKEIALVVARKSQSPCANK